MSFAPNTGPMPVRSALRRLDGIDDSKIHSIILVAVGRLKCVIVARERSAVIVIRPRDLPDAMSIEGCFIELKRRVSESENGTARLLRIEQRELFLRRIFSPPWFILGLAGIFGLVFWQTEPWLDSEQFVERVFFGASVLDLVKLGEIYRLVTANFLHTGWPHLINNLIALIFFGWMVEAAIGAKRTALLMFAAGTVGYALVVPVYGFSEEYSFSHAVGSSAAVWGLQGACALITTRRRRDLPVGFRVPILVWGLIAIQILFQFVFPTMSIFMHFCGGAVGLVGLAFMTRNDRALPLSDSSGLTPSVVTVALVVLVSLGFAIRNDRVYGMQPYFERIHQRLASPGTSDRMRNDYSFIFAVASKAPEQSMQLALEIMKGVVERDPIWAYRDTLATLYYRTGELDRAIEIARAIRWEVPTTWTDSQLARFYAAGQLRGAKAGRGLSPLMPGPDDFAGIEVLRSEGSDQVEFAVTLTPLEPRPTQVQALVYLGDELHSFLEIDVEWILRGERCELSMGSIPGINSGPLTARIAWYGTPDPGAVSLTSSCRLKTLVSDVWRLP